MEPSVQASTSTSPRRRRSSRMVSLLPPSPHRIVPLGTNHSCSSWNYDGRSRPPSKASTKSSRAARWRRWRTVCMQTSATSTLPPTTSLPRTNPLSPPKGERDRVREMTARFLIEQMQTAQRDHGTCIVGLSGGSTPRLMYEEIGKALRMALHPNPLPPLGHELVARDPEGFSDPERGVEWRGGGVHIFLVDERYVPPDHPESNQRLVRETLLRHTTIPEENILFPDTLLPLADSIVKYTVDLKAMIN